MAKSQQLTGMAREVAEKYKETLVTLTFNNKIVINTLTEIAKEDRNYASVIVSTIEERLRKVRGGIWTKEKEVNKKREHN